MTDNSKDLEEINEFLGQIDSKLSDGFITFYKTTNGEIFDANERYGHIWSLKEIVQLNIDYNVEEFAPELLVFGSDGADTAYAIERLTGNIYEMPFIAMSRKEAKFIASSFNEFIKPFEEFDE